MPDTSHQERAIAFRAASELNESGYKAARVAGSSRLIDIIAWKGDQILFLGVARSRNAGIIRHAKRILALVDKVKTGEFPGKVQFWVYQAGTWRRYEIMPGGALPITRGEFPLLGGCT